MKRILVQFKEIHLAMKLIYKFKSYPILLLFFVVFSTSSKAQNLDLIITQVGDSIACRIDSVTDTHIYFEMKFNYNWGPADLEKEDYADYQFKVINLDYVKYKEGTSFIIEYKDRGTSMVNDVYVPPKYRREEAEEIIASKPKSLNKNAFYVNLGTLIVYSSISVNYERLLLGGDGKSPVALFGRLGYGGYYITDGYYEESANIAMISAVILTGRGSGHFEGSLGYLFLQGDFARPLQFAAGFRYQAPGKMLMFKVGGGTPEIVYFGIGVSF